MSKKNQVIGLYAVNTKKIVFRDINSNSAGETEEHIERQEKVKSNECENVSKMSLCSSSITSPLLSCL